MSSNGPSRTIGIHLTGQILNSVLHLMVGGGKKSLFMFLIRLAWKCRYSMPLILSGTAALLGRAYMIQIRVHREPIMNDHELQYYMDEVNDDGNWDTDTDSEASWETVVEEVAYL